MSPVPVVSSAHDMSSAHVLSPEFGVLSGDTLTGINNIVNELNDNEIEKTIAYYASIVDHGEHSIKTISSEKYKKLFEVKVYGDVIIITNKEHRWTKDEARLSQEFLYVFGENEVWQRTKDIQYSTQGVIREFPNAYGVCTCYRPGEGYRDNTFRTNAIKILKDLKNIVDAYASKNYKYVIFPGSGLGTETAALNTAAPKTYNFLLNAVKIAKNDIIQIKKEDGFTAESSLMESFVSKSTISKTIQQGGSAESLIKYNKSLVILPSISDIYNLKLLGYSNTIDIDKELSLVKEFLTMNNIQRKTSLSDNIVNLLYDIYTNNISSILSKINIFFIDIRDRQIQFIKNQYINITNNHNILHIKKKIESIESIKYYTDNLHLDKYADKIDDDVKNIILTLKNMVKNDHIKINSAMPKINYLYRYLFIINENINNNILLFEKTIKNEGYFDNIKNNIANIEQMIDIQTNSIDKDESYNSTYYTNSIIRQLISNLENAFFTLFNLKNFNYYDILKVLSYLENDPIRHMIENDINMDKKTIEIIVCYKEIIKY